MAKQYAGVLGSLALAIVMLRGAASGAGFEGTVLAGVASMIVLAGVGFVVGAVAETTIDDSVRKRLETELGESAGTTTS